jgi:hypothetical protein
VTSDSRGKFGSLADLAGWPSRAEVASVLTAIELAELKEELPRPMPTERADEDK